MTDAELWDALDGLKAYDGGALDSGIHDEALRQRVKEYLVSLPEPAALATLSRFIRDMYLTDTAITQGYGIESVADFIRWMRDEMEFYLP